MLIGIDGNEANVEERVGIGEYAYELLKQFERFKIKDLRFKIYLKSKPLDHMPKEREGWRYIVFGPKLLWTQFALPLKLFIQTNKPDVFFSPSHYAPRFSPVPSAISIMDLSFIHFPDMFKQKDLRQLRSWTSYSARQASLIFTISDTSKNDIIKEYKLASNRVVVTHLGVKQKEDSSMVKDIRDKYDIDTDFILFVGTIQPRKNLQKLIEAFSKISNKSMKLVVVGKKGWQYEEILEAPQKFGVSDRVRFLDFVSDEDLMALYIEAACFVLPSLYEGFGLPILEAMKYGCPVITSNVSSMPEAGGDAALYVDPENVDDIARNIEKLLNDQKLRSDLIEKGYKQIKKFSWEKTAKQTLEALEKVAAK
jgi:glycosyltransferase involved in cell wall biosynthesis